jgi:very-short-patch-repair endonuclease
VLSLDELLACGLTRKEVRGRVERGQLHRIHRSVYAVGHPGLTREGLWLAAVKACGAGALLCRYAAGMHYGFLPFEDHWPQVVANGRRSIVGVRTFRTGDLQQLDRWRHRGIPITTVERTLLDLAATMPDKGLRRAMSRAQSLRLTSPRQLAAILDRTGARPGRKRYARVLAGAPPATRSELEDRVHDLILAGGFAAPDVNVPLRIAGRRVIPDFRWPALRLVVEADGLDWHDNPQARADDAERQALLEAVGERVVRVTWEQATAQVAQTHARLTAAGAPPAGSDALPGARRP